MKARTFSVFAAAVVFAITAIAVNSPKPANKTAACTAAIACPSNMMLSRLHW